MQQDDVPQVQHLLLLPVRGIPAQAQPLRTLLRQNHYVLQPTIPGEATFSLTRALFSPISLENVQTKVDVRLKALLPGISESPKGKKYVIVCRELTIWMSLWKTSLRIS